MPKGDASFVPEAIRTLHAYDPYRFCQEIIHILSQLKASSSHF